MQVVRPFFASCPHRFGRGPRRVDADRRGPSLTADLKLFVVTFAAGFLFVSILIG